MVSTDFSKARSHLARHWAKRTVGTGIDTENTLLIHIPTKLLKLTIEYSHSWLNGSMVPMNLAAQSICNYNGFSGVVMNF